MSEHVEIILHPLKVKQSLGIAYKKGGKKVGYHSVKNFLTDTQKRNLDLAWEVKRVWDNRHLCFSDFVRIKMRAKRCVRTETMLECFRKKSLTIL